MKHFPRLFCLILLAAVLSGCRKKMPDPPRVRSDLVLGILYAMERGDHAAALAQVKRLKTVDPTNVFLAELEDVEQSNAAINAAEKRLAAGDRSGAEKLIRIESEKNGQSPNLRQATIYINALSVMEQTIPRLKNPRSADELERALWLFRRNAAQVPGAGKLLQYADARSKELPAIRSRERKITLLGMECDLRTSLQNNDSIAQIQRDQCLLEREQIRKSGVYAPERLILKNKPLN